MDEDKILYCLLSHKALKSESEKKIMDILSLNYITSGRAEKDYCLARGFLSENLVQFDNGRGGWIASLQTSLSSLGETEIMRLWEKSELNPKVKRERRCIWLLKYIILPFLGLLATAILGYISQTLTQTKGT